MSGRLTPCVPLMVIAKHGTYSTYSIINCLGTHVPSQTLDLTMQKHAETNVDQLWCLDRCRVDDAVSFRCSWCGSHLLLVWKPKKGRWYLKKEMNIHLPAILMFSQVAGVLPCFTIWGRRYHTQRCRLYRCCTQLKINLELPNTRTVGGEHGLDYGKGSLIISKMVLSELPGSIRYKDLACYAS